jgi:hypothetical protein
MEIARLDLKSEAGFGLTFILHAPETVSPVEAVCRLAELRIHPDGSQSRHETPVRGADTLQALALALRLLVSLAESAREAHGPLLQPDGGRFDPEAFGFPAASAS